MSTPVESSPLPVATFDELLQSAESQLQVLTQQLGDFRKSLQSFRKVAHKSGKKQAKKVKVETLRNVSKELATFLNAPQASRSQAIKAISVYIKEHNLQSGKNFKVDALLATLLKVEKESVHTYISINGKLSPHFV